MTQVSADFETGVNGAAIATGDAGSATAWNAVNQTGGTVTYDNTHVAHGTLAAKLAGGGTGSYSNVLVWSTAMGTLTTYFGRFYMYFASNPGATGTCRPIQFFSSGSSCWALDISSAGVITIENGVPGTIGTFATALPLGAWTRVEYHVTHLNLSNGSIEVKLFAGDAAAATETVTLNGANQVLRANADTCAYQVGSLSTTYWLDDVIQGAAAYPGPAVVASSSKRVRFAPGGGAAALQGLV